MATKNTKRHKKLGRALRGRITLAAFFFCGFLCFLWPFCPVSPQRTAGSRVARICSVVITAWPSGLLVFCAPAEFLLAAADLRLVAAVGRLVVAALLGQVRLVHPAALEV